MEHLIAQVENGSPAWRMGLRAGDTLRLYMETEGLAGAPYFPKGVRCVCRQEGDGVFSFTVEFGKEAA